MNFFSYTLFVLLLAVQARADFDDFRYSAVSDDEKIIAFSNESGKFIVVISNNVCFSGVDSKGISFRKNDGLQFSISLPRPSEITVVSGEMVSSVRTTKEMMIEDKLEKNWDLSLKDLFGKFKFLLREQK